jgi:flagellar hook-length control protein FliK
MPASPLLGWVGEALPIGGSALPQPLPGVLDAALRQTDSAPAATSDSATVTADASMTVLPFSPQSVSVPVASPVTPVTTVSTPDFADDGAMTALQRALEAGQPSKPVVVAQAGEVDAAAAERTPLPISSSPTAAALAAGAQTPATNTAIAFQDVMASTASATANTGVAPGEATAQTVPIVAATPSNIETSAARPAVWTSTVTTPMHNPQWDAALGERVVVMAKQDINFAEIRLNPAHLGPVEVRLSVHQDQAQVVLIANHAGTREALEAALPRLRDMLADAGLTLSSANVASQSFAEQRGRDGAWSGANNAPAAYGDDSDGTHEAQKTQTIAVNWRDGGVVDLFA